jgi:hypothetical protein
LEGDPIRPSLPDANPSVQLGVLSLSSSSESDHLVRIVEWRIEKDLLPSDRIVKSNAHMVLLGPIHWMALTAS